MLDKGNVFAFGKAEDVLTEKNISQVYKVGASVISTDAGKILQFS